MRNGIFLFYLFDHDFNGFALFALGYMILENTKKVKELQTF
jgi:hypothetical protein